MSLNAEGTVGKPTKIINSKRQSITLFFSSISSMCFSCSTETSFGVAPDDRWFWLTFCPAELTVLASYVY